MFKFVLKFECNHNFILVCLLFQYILECFGDFGRISESFIYGINLEIFHDFCCIWGASIAQYTEVCVSRKFCT